MYFHVLPENFFLLESKWDFSVFACKLKTKIFDPFHVDVNGLLHNYVHRH